MTPTTATPQQRFVPTSTKPGAPGKNGAPAEGGEDGAKTKDRAKTIKKAGLGLVCLLLVAFLGYKFFGPKAPPPPPEGGAVVQMDPLTLNLSGGHYLKIALALQLVKGKDKAEGSGPAIETGQAAELTIKEFSNRDADVLSTEKGRLQLVDELKKKISDSYEGKVFTVFVTTFVTT